MTSFSPPRKKPLSSEAERNQIEPGAPKGRGRGAKAMQTTSDPAKRIASDDRLRALTSVESRRKEERVGSARRKVRPAEDVPRTELDTPVTIGDVTLREFHWRIELHQDVLDFVEREQPLKRRLGIVLRRLAAHGRTTAVKGCRGNGNEGWRRSPLGGTNGMQFYLWWCPQGTGPLRDVEVASESVYVRAIRLHDDHSPLSPGSQADYLPMHQSDGIASCFGDPWTGPQRAFINSREPVRVLVGSPGSGKTTALWGAVDTRPGERVLYLTWSSELARNAEEYFRAFAPSDTSVVAKDFLSFLGEVCREDVPRQALRDARQTFRQAASRLSPRVLGPWSGREDALYGELRAVIFGRAIPAGKGCVESGSLWRLDEKAYLGMRGGRNAVGENAARVLLQAVRAYESRSQWGDVFPELVAAHRALSIIGHGGCPPSFESFDRIVVDEVQDLTHLEFRVVLDLARLIGHATGRSPKLLVAGDDAQTVRPTAFEWGACKDSIRECIGPPREHTLGENLRCPARIAEIIQRVGGLYTKLGKERRPTKQRRDAHGPETEARVYHVDARDREKAKALVTRLIDTDGIVVLTANEDVPEWVPARLRGQLLTPSLAKGLEYQSVAILDPGRTIARLKRDCQGKQDSALREHLLRTSIDQLRVAISRTTETLVFVDVMASSEELEESRRLLKDAPSFDPEDLADFLENHDVSIEEQVLARAGAARTLVEENPERAWRLATQAWDLVGPSAASSDIAVYAERKDAIDTLLSVGSRILLQGNRDTSIGGDIVGTLRRAAKELDLRYERAVEALVSWGDDRSASPIRMLEAIACLPGGGESLRDAFACCSQELRRGLRAGALDRQSAAMFSGEVEHWLKLAGVGDAAEVEAQTLRESAVGTLIATGKIVPAEEVWKRTASPSPVLTARLREAQERYEEAAEAFEQADAQEDARRCWRQAGSWARALKLCPEEAVAERADLAWLAELNALLSAQPEDLADRLTNGERRRLAELLKGAKAGTAGGRRSRA